MARFLFTGWPYPGCINPQMAVAHALRQRGHTAGFYNGTRMRTRVLNEGFKFFPLGQALDEHVEFLMMSPTGIASQWSHPWRLMPMFRSFFLDTILDQVEDLKAIIDCWAPDVIVCERPMWGPYLIVAELRQIPVSILEYAVCLLPGRDVSYPGLAYPPPHNWFTRLRNRIGVLGLTIFSRGFRRYASQLRQRYGLPPLDGTVQELSGRLPLTLVPSCPEFDYNRRDLSPSVQYVGPCMWYPPSPEPVEWLNQLPRDRPWVHVSEGTLYSQKPVVLRAAVRGLAERPVQVIITTGDHRDPAILDLDRLPANVLAKRWIPHSELMPLLDVLVTHGGGGTVVAALAAGVPMVVVPLMWDQFENAQRVAHAGAGIKLSARACTPEGLRAAVDHVLQEPSYRKNARRLAERLRGYGGPGQAAELLERIVPATGG
jgi:MGT family glycosyltransferase